MSLRPAAGVTVRLRSHLLRALLPISLLVLLALRAAEVRAQSLPTPQTLAARHDSIIGGREVLEGHQSLRLTGSFAIPDMGLDAPIEILKRRPNQYLMRANLGPIGEMLSGYDGTVAWTVQPGSGALILEGEMATQVRDQADFFGDLHDYSRFASVATLDPVEFEGRQVFPVRMVRASGDTLTEFFDASTGLSAGSRTAIRTPIGRIEMTSIVGEYKRFDGLLVATRIEQRNPQYRMIISIEKVEFDLLDADALAPPESVRALIKPPQS
jgi:hypothetical protein